MRFRDQGFRDQVTGEQYLRRLCLHGGDGLAAIVRDLQILQAEIAGEKEKWKPGNPGGKSNRAVVIAHVPEGKSAALEAPDIAARAGFPKFNVAEVLSQMASEKRIERTGSRGHFLYYKRMI
ncbi:hypothetical protein FACS1894185_3350 [Betaproteobacteria bacterium]|nr:hypothetical protein FACS1894185_3350 [Betaproteobacteria bacterium]